MMPDKFSVEKRSKIMKTIKSKDTKPEKLLRGALWKRNWRYRIHCDLPGKPDIVFRRHKTIIFVDGCFWHKCPRCFKPPKSNIEYWSKKLQRNVERDEKYNKILEESGWFVLRFWEHEILENIEKVIGKIERNLLLIAKEKQDEFHAIRP